MLFALRCIRTYIFPRQNMFKFGGFSSRLRSPTHTLHIYICIYTDSIFHKSIYIYISMCDIQTQRICWFTRLLVLFQLTYVIYCSKILNGIWWIWMSDESESMLSFSLSHSFVALSEAKTKCKCAWMVWANVTFMQNVCRKCKNVDSVPWNYVKRLGIGFDSMAKRNHF